MKPERMAREAMDICQLQCQEQCIDHIPYYLSGLSCALFFPTPFLEVAVYISLRCTPWDNLLKQLLKANRVIPETQ